MLAFSRAWVGARFADGACRRDQHAPPSVYAPVPSSLNLSSRLQRHAQAGSGSILRPTAAERAEWFRDVSSPAAIRCEVRRAERSTLRNGDRIDRQIRGVRHRRHPRRDARLPPLATMRVAFTPERSSMRRTTKPLACVRDALEGLGPRADIEP